MGFEGRARERRSAPAALLAAALALTGGCSRATLQAGSRDAAPTDAAQTDGDAGVDVAADEADGSEAPDRPALDARIVSDAPRGCGESGWCQVWKATATGRGPEWLRRAWGSGPNDVWIVGEKGTILHGDGATWTPVPSGTTANLWSIWGAGPKDVWAVGDANTVLRWDGTRWRSIEVPIVDEEGSALTLLLASVWGTGPQDIWIVGERGIVARWDGVRWSVLFLPGLFFAGRYFWFSDVWGTGPDDVWLASGDDSEARRWNGTAFVPWPGDAPPRRQDSIWGSGPKDVWISDSFSVHHWNGETWSEHLPDGSFHAGGGSFWGTGPGDVWFATGKGNTESRLPEITEAGSVHHWNGQEWTALVSGGPAPQPLFGIWASGPEDVWAFGASGAIVHGGVHSPFTNGSSTTRLNAIGGSAPDDVWAVGTDGSGLHDCVLHWNGAAWSVATSGTAPALFAVWARAPNDVWAVGRAGTILHGDGVSWGPVSSGTTVNLTGVWGSARDDVWAVGDGGTVLHWQGTAWQSVAAQTKGDLYSVWGSGPRDVWVVGVGAIQHWDGTTWMPLIGEKGFDPGAGQVITNVWGHDPFDVWFTSTSVLHWNGLSLQEVPQGWTAAHAGSRSPETIWGTGPANVWVAGNDGTLTHWDGFEWSESKLDSHGKILGVWGADRSDLWLVVDDGAILHH